MRGASPACAQHVPCVSGEHVRVDFGVQAVQGCHFLGALACEQASARKGVAATA